MTYQSPHDRLPLYAKPRVTVLLACLGSPWLSEAMVSVLRQTFADFELLVLDDVNSAGTEELVASFRDRRIRYFPNQGSQLGPAGNHSRGLRLARADLVAIINHDDKWHDQLLERLVGVLETTPGAVVAFCDHGCLDEEGRQQEVLADRLSMRYGRASLPSGLHKPFKDLAVVQRAIPVAQCAVWRRELVGRIPNRVYGAYDLWISYRLSRSGAGAVFVAERLADWRVSSGSLSATPTLRLQWGVAMTLIDIVRDPKMFAQVHVVGLTLMRQLLAVLGLAMRCVAHRSGGRHR